MLPTRPKYSAELLLSGQIEVGAVDYDFVSFRETEWILVQEWRAISVEHGGDSPFSSRITAASCVSGLRQSCNVPFSRNSLFGSAAI